MPSVDDMMTGVRRYLGSDCKAQRPNEGQVLHALLVEIQAFYNEASLTGQAWAVDEYSFSVSPGVEDYVVPLKTSLGKPLQILTCYPQNPSTIQRQIDVYEVQNLNVDWIYPQNVASSITNWDGAPNTAMRMSLFYKGAQATPTIRVKPIPALAAEYTVLFLLGDISSYMAMQTHPMLSLHHPLIEVRTAIQELPYAEWFDDESLNSNRRKEIALALSDVRDRYQHNFERFVKGTTLNTSINYRRTYAI